MASRCDKPNDVRRGTLVIVVGLEACKIIRLLPPEVQSCATLAVSEGVGRREMDYQFYSRTMVACPRDWGVMRIRFKGNGAAGICFLLIQKPDFP